MQSTSYIKKAPNTKKWVRNHIYTFMNVKYLTYGHILDLFSILYTILADF